MSLSCLLMTFGYQKGEYLSAILSLANTIMINTVALLLFGIQQSVMARPTFKRWFIRFINPSVERTTYVLATTLAICGMFYL